jgi:hypothetical protein
LNWIKAIDLTILVPQLNQLLDMLSTPAAVVAYTAPADKEGLKVGDAKVLGIFNKLFAETEVAYSG